MTFSDYVWLYINSPNLIRYCIDSNNLTQLYLPSRGKFRKKLLSCKTNHSSKSFQLHQQYTLSILCSSRGTGGGAREEEEGGGGGQGQRGTSGDWVGEGETRRCGWVEHSNRRFGATGRGGRGEGELPESLLPSARLCFQNRHNPGRQQRRWQGNREDREQAESPCEAERQPS